MRIGITITIQSSTFSGGVNTTAMHLATLLKEAGHDIWLVNNTKQSWFDDNKQLAKQFNVVPISDILETRCATFDVFIECAWLISGDLRIHVARSNIVVIRKPPIFSDLEASVYAIRLGNNRADRVDSIWCVGEFSPEDKIYMQLLYSDRQVFFLPFVWYPNIVDSYCEEIKKTVLPATSAWEIHICESNQSITSNALIPLATCRDLTAECIRLRISDKPTWYCHSAEQLKETRFFMSNLFNSLFPEDLSKNLVPRIPLPLLQTRNAIILSHSRFAGVRAMYLDALWLGIPLVHNVPELDGLGYMYNANNISEAVKCILESRGARQNVAKNQATIRAKWIPSKKTLETYQHALATIKFRIPVKMETLLTVYPEKLAGRTMQCGVVDDAVPTCITWNRDASLRQCKYAVACTLAGVFLAKTAGCVPIYVAPEPLENKYNNAAYIHCLTYTDAEEVITTTTEKQWISAFMQPIMLPQESRLPQMITEAHLINLERRPDRLERFNKVHQDLSGAVQRFNAVDGRTLALTDELRHLFRNNRFGWKKGVLGCTLSHYKVWQRLAADSSPTAAYLILEDDVVLDPIWKDKWNAMIDAAGCIPTDVMYLGGVLPPNRAALSSAVEVHDDTWATFKNAGVFAAGSKYFHMCAYAYVMTRHGARKLVQLVEKEGLERVSDHMMCDNFELLNLGLLYPTVAGCYQDEDPRYATAQFNNYKRAEQTDTDLWNNDDRFSEAEILGETGEIILPPTLRDGMPVDEAFSILTSHYANPWVLSRVCFGLGMNHHGFFTLHKALGSADSLTIGNPIHVKNVLGIATSKILEFKGALEPQFIHDLIKRITDLKCTDKSISNELAVFLNACVSVLNSASTLKK